VQTGAMMRCDLPISPCISLYLPISPYISLGADGRHDALRRGARARPGVRGVSAGVRVRVRVRVKVAVTLTLTLTLTSTLTLTLTDQVRQDGAPNFMTKKRRWFSKDSS